MKPRENFLVFGAPSIQQEEIDEVVATLESGWLGTGPKTAQFETEMAQYKGRAHAVALNSCTAALHLALLVADIRPGDEVITTPLTFCATVNAIIHAGGTPVLADVDPVTMNIDPDRVQDCITHRTRAILPVHFAGRPCHMDALCRIAQEHNLTLIEDCAHAVETTYRGRHAGTFGDLAAFSFYVTKNLVTGEGGMLLTDDGKLAARIKTLALHGMSKDAWHRFSDAGYQHYQVTEAGFKYNMMDIQAALGLHQLRRLESNWKKRQKIWETYNTAFRHLPVTCPAPPEPDTRHGLHLYTLCVDQAAAGIHRDEFLTAMHQRNIGTGVHYLSIAEHPFYQDKFGWRPEDTPHATAIGRATVSLPLSPGLTETDVADVIESVHQVLTARS